MNDRKRQDVYLAKCQEVFDRVAALSSSEERHIEAQKIYLGMYDRLVFFNEMAGKHKKHNRDHEEILSKIKDRAVFAEKAHICSQTHIDSKDFSDSAIEAFNEEGPRIHAIQAKLARKVNATNKADYIDRRLSSMLINFMARESRHHLESRMSQP